MNEDPRLTLAHVQECMVQSFRRLAAWPDLEFFADAEQAWTQSSVAFPLFNSVLRVSGAEDGWSRAVRRAVRRSAARKTPTMWWGFGMCEALRTALTAQGFAAAGHGRAMVVEKNELRRALASRPAPPAEVVVRPVESERDLRAWSEICCSVFGFPDFAANAFYEMNKAAGLGPDAAWRHFTGVVSGEPVAVSSLYHGCSGNSSFAPAACCAVTNVATAPDARRKGLGGAVTVAALETALTLDCAGVTLLATEQAAPLYASLGFREVGLVELFVWSPLG